VAGILITETSDTPSLDNPNWSTTNPTEYTFSSAGSKSIYVWAKDAAGNISGVRNGSYANTTITLSDTTKPTVTAFVLPGTTDSQIVPVTTLTASDNVGVIGYKITQSATPPTPASPGLGGWVATMTSTSTYTAAGTGMQTFYAWAEDAAGNVSAVHAPVTVDVPVVAILWQDTFDRADGAPGNGWLIFGNAAHTLISNSLVRTAGNGLSASLNPAGGTLPAGYYVTYTLNNMMTVFYQYFGIAARWLNGTGVGAYMVTAGHDVEIGTLPMSGFGSGDVPVTITGGKPTTWFLNQKHTIGLHVSGSTMTVYLDGQEYGYATVSTNNVAGTGVGIWGGANSAVDISDITVTDHLPMYSP
jgi:hypothetical protein